MIDHLPDRGYRHRRGQVYDRSNDIGDGQSLELDYMTSQEVSRLVDENVGESIGRTGPDRHHGQSLADARQVMQLGRRLV
jgi:hypothetical protein